jgi:hypothetical protein
MKIQRQYINALIVSTLVLWGGCEAEDPVKEDAPELITKVTLTFKPATGFPIIATATDPDGEGVENIATDGPIRLDPKVSYILEIELFNTLVNSDEEGYDITSEVRKEADEHIFFFGWSGSIFSDPAGDGNIDSRSDDVNYRDEDTNKVPVGLTTQWTTAVDAASGKLKILLKHQPEVKSATTSSAIGETDLDVEFDVIVD